MQNHPNSYIIVSNDLSHFHEPKLSWRIQHQRSSRALLHLLNLVCSHHLDPSTTHLYHQFQTLHLHHNTMTHLNPNIFTSNLPNQDLLLLRWYKIQKWYQTHKNQHSPKGRINTTAQPNPPPLQRNPTRCSPDKTQDTLQTNLLLQLPRTYLTKYKQTEWDQFAIDIQPRNC